ncbi:MAG: extracellular solute-binding protein [Provencibacterium sp.]|nr:extracellular solute-binding protein [Provencibacterium sp.]
MRKWVAILLSAVLLGGCSARQPGAVLSETGEDPPAAVPLGRYVETEWTLPPLAEETYILRIKPAESGYDLAVAENDVPRRFHSENGKDWEEVDAALLQQAIGEKSWLSGMDWTQDGQYYLLAYDTESEESQVKRSTGNGWETLPVDWSASGDSLYPQGLQLGADGSLFFPNGMDSTYRYSVSGEYLGSYPGFSFGTPLKEQLAFYLDESREIRLCSLETGEETGRTPVDPAVLSGGGYPLLTADGDALCLVSTGGIFRLAPGGSLFEQAVAGNSCSLGKPSLSPSRCACGPDGSFLVQMSDVQNDVYLYHYAYDPTLPSRPDKELTVAALTEQPTVRQAAAEFQMAHPDVLVTIRLLLEEGGAMTRSDALRALNTELLASSGPDVLALDGLPLASYEEKGVLLDLSETVGPLLEGGELFPNIAGAFRRENGLYAVPTRFTVPLLCVPPEHADWDSLPAMARWAEENPDKQVLYNLEPDDLLRLFYPSCTAAWTHADGSVDPQPLAEFLTCLETLAQSGKEDFSGDLSALFGGEPPSDLPEGMSDILAPLRMAYGRTESFPLNLVRFADFRAPYAAISARLGSAPAPEQTAEYLLPLPGMGGKAFAAREILGVNAAGGQKELALAFLETALGEAVQSTDLRNGLAVHPAALQASLDTDGNWISSMRDPEGNTLMEEITPLEAQLPLLDLFRSLDTPAPTDEMLLTFLQEEADSFFQGARSAADTAAAYSERARAYLNE